MTLTELRDALARATRPDRNLDWRLYLLAEVQIPKAKQVSWNAPMSLEQYARSACLSTYFEHTRNLGAARLLIPKREDGTEWYWRVGHGAQDAGWCHLNRLHLSHCDRGDEIHATAATPELALCLARIEYELARAALKKLEEGS